MNVPLALLADAANISQEGKLNVLGAFNNITASRFPAVHPAMVLVLQLKASPAEYGQTKQFEIKILDADGDHIADFMADLQVDKPEDPAAPNNNYVVMNVPPMPFPHAGDYAVHILIGGEDKAEVPFRLTDGSIDRTQEVGIGNGDLSA